MVDKRHPDLLGMEKAKKILEKKRQEELRIMRAKYKQVFDNPLGREVFKDIMEFCMVFKTTMTGNSWTYFNEGKRAVGLHILNMREVGWSDELDHLRLEHEKKFKEKDQVSDRKE